MIRNRLSLLMTERGLSASKVGNDTKIAKSTLSKISNNNSSKIDYSTINTLCNYLKITPADFFEYSPFDASFYCDRGDLIEPHTSLSFNLTAFINFTKYGDKYESIEFNGFSQDMGHFTNGINDYKNFFEVYLNPIDDTSNYLNELSITFQTQIKEDFSQFVKAYLETQWEKDGNKPAEYDVFISLDKIKPEKPANSKN